MTQVSNNEWTRIDTNKPDSEKPRMSRHGRQAADDMDWGAHAPSRAGECALAENGGLPSTQTESRCCGARRGEHRNHRQALTAVGHRPRRLAQSSERGRRRFRREAGKVSEWDRTNQPPLQRLGVNSSFGPDNLSN